MKKAMKTTKLRCTLCCTRFTIVPLSKEEKRIARCAAAGGSRLCLRCLKYNREALQAVVDGHANACILRIPPKQKPKTERRKRNAH